MTDDARRAVEPARSDTTPLAEAVVVAGDPSRLTLYRSALRMAGVTARLTDDPAEAERLLTEARPAALVLDDGLPPPAALQLYGIVRGGEQQPPVPIVFVGQHGESGGGDHFLGDETSPLAVAARVSEILGDAPSSVAAAAADAGAVSEPAAAPTFGTGTAPPPEPATPATPGAQAIGTVDGIAAPLAAPISPRAGAPDQERAGAAGAPAEQTGRAEAAPTAAPGAATGRRLDVILLRVGIVLFILGLVLLFFWPGSLPRPVTPPPTPASEVTPTPAALLVPWPHAG